jgi:hypothetical protein
MLTSLSLNKIGYGALSEKEGEALTAALLKNAQAWDIGKYIENPRVAAALDLAGVFVTIMTPRVIEDARRRAAAAPSSPTQAAAAAVTDAPALAPAA